MLPILAFLTLHHKYIWVIRHLALAVPSKAQSNQQNKNQNFKHLKHRQKLDFIENKRCTHTTTRSGVKVPVAALYSNL